MSTNAGGIVSTWLYPKSSAPNYKFAAKFNLALNCLMIVGMALNMFLLMRRNREKVEQREGILSSIDEKSALEQYELLGDHHPDFKYTL
jgi:hypothetical protein